VPPEVLAGRLRGNRLSFDPEAMPVPSGDESRLRLSLPILNVSADQLNLAYYVEACSRLEECQGRDADAGHLESNFLSNPLLLSLTIIPSSAIKKKDILIVSKVDGNGSHKENRQCRKLYID